MGALETVELVVVTVVLLLAGSIAFVWLRRRYLAEGRPLLFCAVRTGAQPRWRLGFVRFRGDQLEWFSVVGPRMTPEQTWVRHELDPGPPMRLDEEIPGLPEAVAVPIGHAGTEFAVHPATYTAVRAWHESSPPGFNVNVA